MIANLTKQKLRLLGDFGIGVLSLPVWFPLPHISVGLKEVGDDFFGVNVASADDPAYDDYVIARLRQAQIDRVRVSIDADGLSDYRVRFIQRLLDENMHVMLALLPSFEDAQRFETDEETLYRWREFVRAAFTTYQGRIELFEIGNTPNRPSWSGYSVLGYIRAWEIAHEEAAKCSLSLAGPNISDFEPVFNAAYLRYMDRNGMSPAVQTDNLFVERCVEPERYDPSALGKPLRDVLRLNLVKKIHILAAASQRYGGLQTFCTYTCWTTKRLARWSVIPEQKGAHYLARYLIISAATKQLDRVYWGPLIDQRDGLILCGSEDYPVVDNVTHYKEVRGALDNLHITPGYLAFSFITTLLRNTTCAQNASRLGGVNHYIFVNHTEEHHIVWALDGAAFELHSLYSNEQIAKAKARNIMGDLINTSQCVSAINESPMVLSWPVDSKPYRPNPEEVAACHWFGPRGTRYFFETDWQHIPFQDVHWQGVVKLPEDAEREKAAMLHPDQIASLPVEKLLRDKRNKLWRARFPELGHDIVVKLNRARGIKRISYHFLPSKGRRHWDTATEMLRRGVHTPTPIGFAERKQSSGAADNYYFSVFLEDAFSTRDLFTAFAQGEEEYRGISKQVWLTEVAGFVAFMHRKKIIHRDLSSGNLMIQLHQGKPKIFAIDIGRAQIDKRMRTSLDIKRICYKLHWPDREFFVAQYQQANPKQPLRFWRLAVHGYDQKLIWKKRLKRMIKRKK